MTKKEYEKKIEFLEVDLVSLKSVLTLCQQNNVELLKEHKKLVGDYISLQQSYDKLFKLNGEILETSTKLKNMVSKSFSF